MNKVNSDFTAVIKDEVGVHVLKCKIIDEQYLMFQMLNKTKNILTPVFKIKADFGGLKYVKPNTLQKELERKLSLTQNINRQTLIMYYNQFKLQSLITQYHCKYL